MSQTETDIANMAGVLLGISTPITSLDDASHKAAREFKRVWAIRRRACLRAKLWRFSLERGTRAAMAEVPAFGWARQFQAPANIVRLVQVGDFWAPDLVPYRSSLEGAPYAYESGVILTNMAAPLKLRWAADREDCTRWDAAFASYFAGDIALWTCEAITQSSSKKGDCQAMKDDAVREALAANAIESPPREFTAGSWENARSWS